MRILVVLAGAALLAAAGTVAGTTVPAPASATVSAQSPCLPPGELIAPVPWAQRLLAPERVWPLTTGAGQRVAILSTGVADTSYLAGRVPQEDFASADGSRESTGERDCLGLGTGVAGIIAAQPTDGVGFQGVAPDAGILSAKVVGDQFPSGQEPADTVAPRVLADGIEWAVDQGATVIAVPTITYQDSEVLRDAVAGALAAGVVVVASVGDQGQVDEPDDLVPYPAAYEGVIGVGSLAVDGTAAISRPGHVDLVAPGADLVTTYPGDGLGPVGGTSFAAGYVAGVVALVRAYRPDLSPAEVAQRLYATAAPAPEAVGSTRYGYGIVDPHAAVTDLVVAGEPVAAQPFEPAVISPQELERQAAWAQSDALASRLVLIGLAAAVVMVVAVGLGANGRRRRWRAGVAAVPVDRPRGDQPELPMDLFAARPSAIADRAGSGD